MILRRINSISNATDAPRVNLRCPACRREATFDGLGFPDIGLYAEGDLGQLRTGQRVCGNPECASHLFVVLAPDRTVLTSYPAETIDFDSSRVPSRVVAAFEEAIKCHAQQCFVAAAIMVRKTMEEICADQGATGNNLKERIASLGETVVMPKALLEGIDDLRLLGNDAAHLESRVYEDVGQEEVEVGIEVSKEILKAVYQYDELMERLRGLKRGADA